MKNHIVSLLLIWIVLAIFAGPVLALGITGVIAFFDYVERK